MAATVNQETCVGCGACVDSCPFGAITLENDKAVIGDACADISFYSQFNGKTEADYGDIDAISGATITTNGYKTAVSKVFEAIKILKGEA